MLVFEFPLVVGVVLKNFKSFVDSLLYTTKPKKQIMIIGRLTVLWACSLLILQKKSIQIMLNSKNKEFVKDHFKNLQLPTVYVMFVYETVLSVVGILIGLNKSYGDGHSIIPMMYYVQFK